MGTSTRSIAGVILVLVVIWIAAWIGVRRGYARELGRNLRRMTLDPQGATISLLEHRWSPLPTDGGPAPYAFLRTGDFTRTAVVAATGESLRVESGVEDLTVMKTTKSAFAGFPRDRYTTLREVDDRIMATKVSATWRYGAADLGWDEVFEGVLRTLLDVLAEHFSPSVQNSIWVMGRAILERHAAVEEIRMVLPNLHHWSVDLSPFGGENRDEIFVATTEPHGLIEATVRRAAG